MRTLLMYLFLLTGCAPPPIINPLLQPGVDQFTQLLRSNGITIPVYVTALFGSSANACEVDNAVGCCNREIAQVPVITISKEFWSRVGPAGQRALLFPELGHCVLGREHTSNVDDNDHPVSYMYPVINGPVDTIESSENPALQITRYDLELIEHIYKVNPFNPFEL